MSALAADPGDLEYQTYLRVRDAVLRIKAREADASTEAAEPSAYWAEELSNIDYLLDASPLIIRKLRHHAFHVTGIRPYDYRDKDDGRPQNFAERLRGLCDLGGADLLVPEAARLGGFGYRINGRLYNLDTLKFFEVLVGMRRAGVLDPFPSAAERRLVWEIGAGWGGFAYQFKTLFPNVTYVITDLPELFLLSAVYLSTLFSDARTLIVGADASCDEIGAWQGWDFVFIPNTRSDTLRVRPDLTVNIASFQEMTTAQVRAYMEQAARLGCPSLYSLNRERSPYNRELDAVSAVLSGFYELREVALLESDYLKATKKGSARAAAGPMKPRGPEDLSYRHLAGALRAGRVAQSTGSAHGAAPGSDRQVRVAFGMTLYNRAAYLPEAIESLLAQTYPHFRLAMLDDGSGDETETIAKRYAERDPRVTYVRNGARRGMALAWRQAFDLAQKHAAGMEYFAWSSDHDRWHPEWLASLVAELDRHPEAVAAYPLAERIDERGRPLDKPPRRFDTSGLSDLSERWRFVCRELAASGDTVYGLMRVEALARAGVFRDVLCPDRLLMAELALQGEFRQIDRTLWFRRDFGSSVQRQRHTLFAGSPPRSLMLPVWLQHGHALWRTYARSEPNAVGLRRAEAARLALRYAAVYALRHHRKSALNRRAGWILRQAIWLKKRAKHTYHQAVYNVLVYGRRGFHHGVYHILMFSRRIGFTQKVEKIYDALFSGR